MAPYKSPTTLSYKPGGFTNLGATPGIIPQPKPPAATPPQNNQNNWQNTLSDVMASRPKTGSVKKIVGQDGTQVHFDNKVGADKGILPPPSTLNVQNPDGSYSSGANIKSQGIIGGNQTAGQITENQPPKPYVPPSIQPTYPGMLGGLTKLSEGNIPIGQSAAQISADYGKKIAEVGQQGAGYQAGALSTGTKPVGEGNAAINAAITAAKQTALATGQTAALKGTEQQLTAQEQAKTGILGGAGLTPEALRYGSDSGALNPLNNIDSIAEQVASGQISPATAYSMGGSIANFKGALNAAILAKNPNYNEAKAQAAYDSNQANIQALSTAATGARAASIAEQTKQFNNLSAARNSVANISNGLISQIANDNKMNPSEINAINGVIQLIANNTSDPQYQKLLNRMTDISSTYGQILTPGGNTDTTRLMAQGLLNQLAGGGTVQSVVADLDKQAQEKIQGIQTNVENLISGSNVNPLASMVGSTEVGPDGNTYLITD